VHGPDELWIKHAVEIHAIDLHVSDISVKPPEPLQRLQREKHVAHHGGPSDLHRLGDNKVALTAGHGHRLSPEARRNPHVPVRAQGCKRGHRILASAQKLRHIVARRDGNQVAGCDHSREAIPGANQHCHWPGQQPAQYLARIGKGKAQRLLAQGSNP